MKKIIILFFVVILVGITTSCDFLDFGKDKKTITAISMGNGTIYPLGAEANVGDIIDFYLSPEFGYEGHLKVDGIEVPLVKGSYTLNVISNSKLEASFTKTILWYLAEYSWKELFWQTRLVTDPENQWNETFVLKGVDIFTYSFNSNNMFKTLDGNGKEVGNGPYQMKSDSLFMGKDSNGNGPGGKKLKISIVGSEMTTTELSEYYFYDESKNVWVRDSKKDGILRITHTAIPKIN